MIIWSIKKNFENFILVLKYINFTFSVTDFSETQIILVSSETLFTNSQVMQVTIKYGVTVNEVEFLLIFMKHLTSKSDSNVNNKDIETITVKIVEIISLKKLKTLINKYTGTTTMW